MDAGADLLVEEKNEYGEPNLLLFAVLGSHQNRISRVKRPERLRLSSDELSPLIVRIKPMMASCDASYFNLLRDESESSWMSDGEIWLILEALPSDEVILQA